MKRDVAILLLVLTVITCITLISGCSYETTPTPIPRIGDRYLTHGYVIIDGKPIGGAVVEAVSADGAYRFNNTTNDLGAYAFYLPKNVSFNITARDRGLRHTIWPVNVGDDFFEYNITLTTTPVSSIEGTGGSVGAFAGYDHSRPLTGFTFNVIPVNGTTTLTPAIKGDKSYSVDVEPGVTYKIERYMPDVWFNYRNSQGHVESVVVGQNETALIDYLVILP